MRGPTPTALRLSLIGTVTTWGWSDTFAGVDPSQLWEKQVLGDSLDSSMDSPLVAATTAEPGGADTGGAEAKAG
eukprot:5060446-Lingulodinium_polyedra.AAC.1